MDQQQTGPQSTGPQREFYSEEVRYIRACCVVGSKSLTRYLGMPPDGEIAIPIHKNTFSPLGVNRLEF